ncbi:small multi-drug export protein [Methanoculleus sp. Wushi-C6]|uniref:Small multi-drug export protein n=1 Tax=Methanoculleus caldifontis TaxID=2651577 RepID=A0ABU3WYS6_9EURY|nr:small multi-drug export protein [Methanoculleus sp. Wushi-C6]MDV2480871.1 small multi-drug export protein [Methanoculleus sp. Wushi-C6]
MRRAGVWDDDGVDGRIDLLKVSVPPLLCGLFLAVVWFLLPSEQWLLLVGMMVAYIVPPLGRETIIPVCILLGIPWWLVASALAFLDFAGGLFMAWNFPLVLRIPYAGPWIRRFMVAGRTFLDRRPWLERLYFVGLILFVSLPFDGSGSIVGSVIGRMLGMTKTEVVACITIGGIIGSFAIALGIDWVTNLIPAGAGPWVSLAVFILIGIALLVMYRSRSLMRETNV